MAATLTPDEKAAKEQADAEAAAAAAAVEAQQDADAAQKKVDDTAAEAQASAVAQMPAMTIAMPTEQVPAAQFKPVQQSPGLVVAEGVRAPKE